jgi:hypothetical protein
MILYLHVLYPCCGLWVVIPYCLEDGTNILEQYVAGELQHALKREAVCSSKMLISIYRWHHYLGITIKISTAV